MIRIINKLLVFVIGAALVGGGLLVVLEGIWTWTNSGFVGINGRQWLDSFKTTAWSEPVVIATSAAVGGLGLLLALSELKPPRQRVAEFQTDDDVLWLLHRRSAETHLGRRLTKAVPASPVRAQLKPGRRRWRLTVTAKGPTSTRPQLAQAAHAELSTLHAPAQSRVKVRTGGSAPPSMSPTSSTGAGHER